MTVAIAFSTDQIVIRVLPSVSPIESSCAITGSSQPRTSAAITRPDDQRRAQLPGLDRAALPEREPEQEHHEADQGEQREQRRPPSIPGPRLAAGGEQREAMRISEADEVGSDDGEGVGAGFRRAWPLVRARYQRRPQSTPTVTKIAVTAITGNWGLPHEGPDRAQQCGGAIHQALRSGISSLSSRRIWSLSMSLRFLRRRSCSSST